MKDIFSELYNKVLGFFRQTEKKEEETAKDVACNRLKFVLMQDRTNLTPELMDRMRKELVDLLSKYVEMDKDALELGFEQEGTQMALMLSIPVVRAKDEAEIEAILAKEDEEKAQKTAETVSDESDIKAEDESTDDTEDEETVSDISDESVESETDTVVDGTDENTNEKMDSIVNSDDEETSNIEKVPVGATTSKTSK